MPSRDGVAGIFNRAFFWTDERATLPYDLWVIAHPRLRVADAARLARRSDRDRSRADRSHRLNDSERDEIASLCGRGALCVLDCGGSPGTAAPRKPIAPPRLNVVRQTLKRGAAGLRGDRKVLIADGYRRARIPILDLPADDRGSPNAILH